MLPIKRLMIRRTLFCLAILALPLSAAQAQNWAQSFSPGEAREAVRKGDILPLKEIFNRLEARYGGYQLDASLFSTAGGGAEYRIDWMTGDGRRLRIRVDARTGRILSSSGG